jgi:hypothetical protein
VQLLPIRIGRPVRALYAALDRNLSAMKSSIASSNEPAMQRAELNIAPQDGISQCDLQGL